MDERDWNQLECENCGLPFVWHGRFVSQVKWSTVSALMYVESSEYVWDACPIPLKSTFSHGEGVQLRFDFWIFSEGSGWSRIVDKLYD